MAPPHAVACVLPVRRAEAACLLDVRGLLREERVVKGESWQEQRDREHRRMESEVDRIRRITGRLIIPPGASDLWPDGYCLVHDAPLDVEGRCPAMFEMLQARRERESPIERPRVLRYSALVPDLILRPDANGLPSRPLTLGRIIHRYSGASSGEPRGWRAAIVTAEPDQDGIATIHVLGMHDAARDMRLGVDVNEEWTPPPPGTDRGPQDPWVGCWRWPPRI